MGRLTLRSVFGKARCKKNGTKFCYETDECLYCKHNDEILERLAHYEDLEEAGRLIELPCALDTVVYYIGQDYKGVNEIHSMQLFTYDSCINIGKGIGGWLYLTKEEAERKLTELEGEQHE